MAQHFSKILYATDYSKASARAFDEAIALTKQNRAELLVLHVIDPVPPLRERILAAPSST